MTVSTTKFVQVPVWVIEHPDLTPADLRVYLAVGRQALGRPVKERTAPKDITGVMQGSGLGRSACYEALTRLRDAGAVVELAGGDLFVPMDDPAGPASATADRSKRRQSATADKPSAQAESPSATVDDPSATADRTFLIEGESTEREPREPANATPVPLTAEEAFDLFWARYPERDGRKRDKPKALAQWKRLTLAHRRAAYRAVLHYAADLNATGVSARDAHRWLRDHAWVDYAEPARSAPVPIRGHRGPPSPAALGQEYLRRKAGA